jgi:hypothetical protein
MALGVPHGLVGMRIRRATAAAIATAAFALVWLVCELVLGVGAVASLATASLLTVIAALGRSALAQVRRVRSGPAGRPAEPSGGRRRDDAGSGKPSTRPQAREPALPRAIATKRVEIIVDRAGLEIRAARARSSWYPRRRIQWSDVTAMTFGITPHDPIIALYASTETGREHLADASLLSRAEWDLLSRMIAESTGRRLNLDLRGLGNPGSLGPDW